MAEVSFIEDVHLILAPLEVESMRALRDSSGVRDWTRRFGNASGGRKILVRVDRADL